MSVIAVLAQISVAMEMVNSGRQKRAGTISESESRAVLAMGSVLELG